MLSLAIRLAGIVCALAIALPALADRRAGRGEASQSRSAQQALERVNKALAAKPRDPQARFLKGLILTEQGNSKEAIEIFTKLTQDYPELPEPYNNLAVIYASQGQYDKARAALEHLSARIRVMPPRTRTSAMLREAREPGVRQGAADRFVQRRGEEQAVAHARAGRPPRIERSSRPRRHPKEAAETRARSKTRTRSGEKPKPAAEKPAPAVEKPAADASAEVLKAVNGWAQAWSKKDADGYLSYYAREFKTPGAKRALPGRRPAAAGLPRPNRFRSASSRPR
jgi:tetratricopeptide (TPR) repeat protein